MSKATLTVSLNVEIPGLPTKTHGGSPAIVQLTGNGYYEKRKTIGTTLELVDFDYLGEANIGLIFILNLDPTNFLKLGVFTDGQWNFAKIYPLMSKAFFPLKPGYATAHWYIAADTAPIQILIAGFEK